MDEIIENNFSEIKQTPPSDILQPQKRNYRFIAILLVLFVISSLFVLAFNYFKTEHLRDTLDKKNVIIVTPTPNKEIDIVESPPVLEILPLVEKTPFPSPTPGDQPASIFLSFKTKYTSEPIDGFEVTVQQLGGPRYDTYIGIGNTYFIPSLDPGKYAIFVRTGDVSRKVYCGAGGDDDKVYSYSNYVEFNLKKGEKVKKEINIYPYPGFLYLKTESGYHPISDAKIELTNEEGNQIYYSTKSDVLGRAVVYTINPNIKLLRITKDNDVFIKKIDPEKCLWIEKIILPVKLPLSDLQVNFTINADYFSLMTDVIVPDVPMEILPNSVGGRIVYDDLRKYTFNETQCPGLSGSGFIIYPPVQKDLNKFDNKNNQLLIQDIPKGKYTICAYDTQPGVYYTSTHPEVIIDGSALKQIDVIYPAPIITPLLITITPTPAI